MTERVVTWVTALVWATVRGVLIAGVVLILMPAPPRGCGW